MQNCQFSGEWEIIPAKNQKNAPSPRCGHTLSIHSSFNAETNFNLSHSQSQSQSQNDAKTKTKTKTTSCCYHSKVLLAFGESSLTSDRKYLNDMYMFDLASQHWVQVLGKNVPVAYKPLIRSNFNPVARADHAVSAFTSLTANQVVVQYQNQLCHNIHNQPVVPPATVDNDRCIMFGGKCQDTYLDDLIMVKNIHTFPINLPDEMYQEFAEESRQATQKTQSQNKRKKKCNLKPDHIYYDRPLRIEPIHLSKGPCGRRGASITFWKDGSFLVFGGQRGSIFLNDLWGLDLYKQGWVELSTKCNPPPRAFHSAFVDDQQKMLILGGVQDTQANPVSADIFKLDLRAGKFVKLGDKDMVPGLAQAINKGHHSSHFLSKRSDLIIYSPQNATCHILGGNTASVHCGKCYQVDVAPAPAPAGPTSTNYGSMSEVPDETNNDTAMNMNASMVQSCSAKPNLKMAPRGSCRPATALLPASKSIPRLLSYGCDKQKLQRLFVFGGYIPSEKRCSIHLRTLKFSTQPCPSEQNHVCKFTPTEIAFNPDTADQENEENNSSAANQQNQQSRIGPVRAHIESFDLNEDKYSQVQIKKSFVSPPTPMKVKTPPKVQNNYLNLISPSLKSKTASPLRVNYPDLKDAPLLMTPQLMTPQLMTPQLMTPQLVTPQLVTPQLVTPQLMTPQLMTPQRNALYHPTRVHLSRTPVRIQSTPNMKFTSYESEVSRQKILQLDPELISPSCDSADSDMNKHAQMQHIFIQQKTVFDKNKKHLISNSHNKNKNHYQFIRTFVFEFKPELLDRSLAFLFNSTQIIHLNRTVRRIFRTEPSLLSIQAPIKIFGDIHGQFADLLSLFKAFGYPDTNLGDIDIYNYLFLGDFVDRGHKSLEVITLLFALKIEYPKQVLLIRGNHECRAMNELYGFHQEIYERIIVEIDSIKYFDNGQRNPSVQSDDENCIYVRSNAVANGGEHQFEDPGVLSSDEDTDDEVPAAVAADCSEDSDQKLPETITNSSSSSSVEECKEDDDCGLSDTLRADSAFELADSRGKETRMSSDAKKKKNKKKKKRKNKLIFHDSEECLQYVVDSFEKTFQWLPLAALINNKILCVHGGIGHVQSIADIAAVQRPCDVACDAQQSCDKREKVIVDLLWSDPAENDDMYGFHENKRGVSCVFGSDVVRNFCKHNDIDLIVRAHQVVKDGYEYFAGGHLITLFSATNYCDIMDNAGAILCVDVNLRVVPKLVESRDVRMQNDWRIVPGCPPSPMRGEPVEDSRDQNVRHDAELKETAHAQAGQPKKDDPERETAADNDYCSRQLTF